MDEHWLNGRIGTETQIRPEFEAMLEERISSEWNGEATVSSDVTPGLPPRRMKALVGIAAVTIVVLAGFLVLGITSNGRVHDDSDTPPASVPETTGVPVTDPGVTPTTQSSTTALPVVPTPITPMPDTETPVTTSEGPADLVIPVDGGAVLQPTELATLPVGQGPGQLTLQNGEFGTPVAIVGDHIVVVEDVPFDGLTGRVLVLDSLGVRQQDIEIPELTGRRVNWVGGSPNGTLFVLSSGTESGELTLIALSLTEAGFDLVAADAMAAPENRFSLTVAPLGILDGTTLVMQIETGAPASTLAVTLDESSSTTDSARVVLADTASTGLAGLPWRIDIGFDSSITADGVTGRSGLIDGAIWFEGNTSGDPAIGGTFIAVLQTDRSVAWARLGPWTVAAADSTRLIVTSTTDTGLAIATVTADAVTS